MTAIAGERSAVAPASRGIDRGRVLLLVLATWAIAMIAPDFYRVFGSFGSFGLVVNNDGVIVDVAGSFETPSRSPAAAAGIAVGDRVDLRAMRCIPIATPACRDLLAVIGGLGGPHVVRMDHAIDLVVAPAGGGASKVVHLQPTRTTRGFLDRLVLFADTLVGIIVILAAARLVWIAPGTMTWGFFVYVMWFNPGQTFAYYALLEPWPAAILLQEIGEAFVHGAGYAGLLVFALRFPNDVPSPSLARYERMAWAMGATIGALWLASYANAFGLRTEALSTTALLLGYVVDAVIVFVLVQRRRTLPLLDRQRVTWVISGCAIGLPAFIFAEIAQSTSMLQRPFALSLPDSAIGLLYLLHGVLAYFVSVAVLHRRVISVTIPLRRGTILTLLSLAVGIPIVNLHELLAHYQDAVRIPEWVWLLVVAPIALVLLHRLHELGVHLVDRLLNRRFHRAGRELATTDEAMLAARRPDVIDRLLVVDAVEALALSSGALFRRQDGTYRRTCAVGWDDSAQAELAPDRDALVLSALERRMPVRLPRDAWDESQVEANLREPSIAVPIQSAVLGDIGIALFGPHVDGNDIDEDERDMLAEHARRAVAAYERAAFVDLREEVSELRDQLATLQHSPV